MVRLRTTGTLRVKNQTFTVEGLSWMDHEFSSNAMAADQVGWDWMGLQLDDGSDLMIYRMRNADGKTDYLSGTRIAPDGRPTYLSENQITLNGDFPWKSPTSGGDYPQHWTLAIAGQPPMVVTSQMPGQELVTTASTKVTYFEGAADVSDIRGKSVGLGYLEMTGYAK
jgi:predicted secreted hydrolase